VSLYSLIDTTHCELIGLFDDWRTAGALAYIQFANVDTWTLPLTVGHPFVSWPTRDIALLLSQVLGRSVPEPPTSFQGGEVLRNVMIENSARWLCRYTFEDVEEQAKAIPINSKQAFVYNPTARKPTPVTAWPRNPQGSYDRWRKLTASGIRPLWAL